MMVRQEMVCVMDKEYVIIALVHLIYFYNNNYKLVFTFTKKIFIYLK